MPRKKHKRKASQVAYNTNKKTKQEKGTAPDEDSSANNPMCTDKEGFHLLESYPVVTQVILMIILNITSKDIYYKLFVVTQPEIEKMYPIYDWKAIWRNVVFKPINIHDRNVVFKYIHEILPNNKRLYDMRLRGSPLCINCDLDESNIHLFYYCTKVQDYCLVEKSYILFV